MSIVLDTSIVVALKDTDDRDHERVVGWYEGVDDDVVTTPIVVAEMDHLVAQRADREVLRSLWDDLEVGAITVRWWSTAMAETLAIARERPALGLADASLLALAPVARTIRIATLDRTHFHAARTRDGEPFTLLP